MVMRESDHMQAGIPMHLVPRRPLRGPWDKGKEDPPHSVQNKARKGPSHPS